MIPKGYVLLTIDGAKRALTAKNNAESYHLQLLEKDTTIFNQSIIIEKYKIGVQLLEIQNKDLKRKRFWKDAEKWGLRLAIIFLSGKQAKAW